MPEIKKGNNSANNVSGVTSFNLCKMAGHALHSTKFREIILKGIKVIVGWLVVLLFYVHGKHLRSCRDGQLT